MNRLWSAVALSLVLAASSSAAQSKLTLTTITASPEGFLVTATLVAGEKDAVLIDSAFQQSDAHRLVAQLIESRKNLTHVFVTHAHPDHYFGLNVIKQAFPKAKFVGTAATVAEAKKTWKGKVAQWKPMYGAQVVDAPVVPEVLKGNLTLEGETLEITGPVQGDDAFNSYVWIPSMKALIAGDIVYSGVHPWTAETTPQTRKAWIATLEKLTAMNPSVVVPGHKKPEMKQDASALKFTADYLEAFDEAVASSKTPEEALGKIKAKYADLQLDIIAKLGTDAAFKAKK